jgi:hypothetical protein
MRTPARVVTLLVTGTIPALWAGCGSDSPAFDPSAQYTPESLAQELAFRFRALPGEAKKVSSRRGRRQAAPLKERDLAKSGEAQKKALPQTADALLDDIARKIRAVPGVSPSDACKKVAEAVRQDGSLSSKDRDDLARQLDEMAAEL